LLQQFLVKAVLLKQLHRLAEIHFADTRFAETATILLRLKKWLGQRVTTINFER
jgi:hypothetical protein